ncbi:MAG TPA: ABC transporter substrate-binding protein [Deltaproteobacteria bacterium]|nr:ABC transporter substrate-binding protein [Deltaproteobacteria bacterium]
MKKSPVKALFLCIIGVVLLSACAPTMQQIPTEDPTTLYNTALAQKTAGDLDGAAQAFIRLWKKYPKDDLAPKALYTAASIKAQTNPSQAVNLYRSFIEAYPDSVLLPKVNRELLDLYIREQNYTDGSRLFMDMYSSNRVTEMVLPGIDLSLGLVETKEYFTALEIIAMIYPLADEESSGMLLNLWSSTLEDIDQVEMLAKLENITQDHQLIELLLARQARLYLEQEDQNVAARIMDRLRNKAMQAPTAEPSARKTIGVVIPLSGKWEAVGQKALKGVEFASRVFSKDNTPNIEYIIRDYGSDESTIAGIIEELDREHDVISIIGPIGESAGSISCAEAKSRGIPTFMFTRGDIVSGDESYCFRNFVSVDIQVKTLLQVASDLNITRFAILSPTDHFGNIFADLFIENAPEYGIEIIRQVDYSPQLVDFKDAVNNLIADIPRETPEEPQDQTAGEETEELKIEPDFDALLIPDTAINAAMIASYLPYFGIEGVRLFGPTLWDTPDFIRVGGKYVDEAIFVSGFFLNSQLGFVQDFTNAFYYTFGYSPSVWEASAYDTASILQNLLEGEIHTRESLRRQIATVKDYPGLTGVTSFYRDGSVDKAIYVLTVKGSNIYEIVP